MRVSVEDWTPETKVLKQTGLPTLLCRWRVSLECGCGVLIGLRADNREAAVGAVPHAEEHRPLMATFNELMRKGLEHPSDRQLVDVVADTLRSLEGPEYVTYCPVCGTLLLTTKIEGVIVKICPEDQDHFRERLLSPK